MTEFGRVTKSICQIWTCLVKDFLVVASGSCNVESQYEKKCRITSTEGTYYTYYLSKYYFSESKGLYREV